MQEEISSSWAISSPEGDNLQPLLQYAQNHYANHTEWFLRYRDSGTRTLGLLLTAEFTIIGFHFSENLHEVISVPALVFLALLAIPLTRLSLLSCRKTFAASMEHAILTTKIIWAMGLAEKVKTSPNATGICPASLDKSLYVPRYLSDARGIGADLGKMSTEKFVEMNLSQKGTSYHAGELVLWIMGISSTVIGLFGALGIVIISLLSHSANPAM